MLVAGNAAVILAHGEEVAQIKSGAVGAETKGSWNDTLHDTSIIFHIIPEIINDQRNKDAL